MTEGQKCGISSLFPMSCRGRAEAFARRLHTRLRSLGSQDGNGSADESSWLGAHENPIAISQPRHSSDSDGFLDFNLLESPGSPEEEIEESELHRLINKDNLKHSHSDECHCPKAKEKKILLSSFRSNSNDSDSDGPFYDTENHIDKRLALRVNGDSCSGSSKSLESTTRSDLSPQECSNYQDDSFATTSDCTPQPSSLSEYSSTLSLKDEDFPSLNTSDLSQSEGETPDSDYLKCNGDVAEENCDETLNEEQGRSTIDTPLNNIDPGVTIEAETFVISLGIEDIVRKTDLESNNCNETPIEEKDCLTLNGHLGELDFSLVTEAKIFATSSSVEDGKKTDLEYNNCDETPIEEKDCLTLNGHLDELDFSLVTEAKIFDTSSSIEEVKKTDLESENCDEREIEERDCTTVNGHLDELDSRLTTKAEIFATRLSIEDVLKKINLVTQSCDETPIEKKDCLNLNGHLDEVDSGLTTEVETFVTSLNIENAVKKTALESETEEPETYISSISVDKDLVVECTSPIHGSRELPSISIYKSIEAIITEEDEEEETEERIPRVRRCSSLKTGKTPPGTPGRKKIVRFADVLGLDLADVRTFLDEIPKVPISAYDYLTGVDINLSSSDGNFNGTGKLPGIKIDKILVPLFQQPGGQVNFLDLVREHQVCLENAMVDDPLTFSIKGMVRVRNLDFHKSVYIRYSLDSWKTYADVQAVYVANSCDGFSDKFSFLIYAHTLLVGQRIEFACRFQCKGSQYWDNNQGVNYCFQCLPATNSIPVALTSHEDWGASFYY